MDNKEITKTKESDFSEEEKRSLQEWRDNNMPGLHSLNQDKAFSWFKLYMAGKTYSEIAKMTGTKKDLILFVSERNNWLKLKMTHFSDISTNMLQKYKEAKLESLNTMTTMVSALNKYFGSKFDKYLKTNDNDVLESIDSKMLAQYQKVNESIDKIVAEMTGNSSDDRGRGSGSSMPTININMNGKSSVTQKDDSVIDINSEEDGDLEVREILDNLSKLKKKREKI